MKNEKRMEYFNYSVSCSVFVYERLLKFLKVSLCPLSFIYKTELGGFLIWLKFTFSNTRLMKRAVESVIFESVVTIVAPSLFVQ